MIHDDTPCRLGEGPLWHPEREELFWFDILSQRLHTRGRHWDFDTYVSAAGWIDRDTLLVAGARSLMRFDIESGAREDLCPLEADDPVTRSNDGRADPLGGFWIGTMAIDKRPGAGAIYRFHRGEVTKLFDGITISNAICFSPDGRTAYFSDTPTQVIRRVALDGEGWPMGTPEVFVDLSGTDCYPDGAVVDAEGRLWNAQWGGYRVACYAPDGREVSEHRFPASQLSCPAFGGATLGSLFVTSALEHLPEGTPHEGLTYVVDTEATGQREHRVLL